MLYEESRILNLALVIENVFDPAEARAALFYK